LGQGVDGGIAFVGVTGIAAETQADNPLALQATIGHELGHLLGLIHHNGIGALMNWEIQGSSPTTTCDDVRQFYYVRNWEFAPTCPNQQNYTTGNPVGSD
jgi:hypothetical protein